MFAGLFGSINITVDASIAPSSVSLPPIVAINLSVSSGVVFPKSSNATGASFTGVTVISNVLVSSKLPSVNISYLWYNSVKV